ncbi:MAG: DUF885 family protein [Bacillota bacterium]
MSHSLSTPVAELDHRLVNLWTRYASSGEHETRIFLPTREGVAQLQEKLRKLQGDLESAEPEGFLDRVTLLQMSNVLDALSFRVADDLAFPFRYLSGLSGSVNHLLSMDTRPLQQRLDIMAARLGGTAPLLEAVIDRSRQVDDESRGMVREYLDSLERILADLPEQLASLDADTATLSGTAQSTRDAVARALAHLDVLEPAGDGLATPLPYRERLMRVWGIDLEELLSWHEEEIEECAGRLNAIGAEIDPDRDPYEILETDLPSRDRPEDMFPLMEGFVARAREHSLDYITLPEGEVCEVRPVPAQLRYSYPWGGYNGPDPLLGNLQGAVFLNEWNYRAVTLGWMEMMAIHECYPGHHAQKVKTAASSLPDSFKLSHLMNRSGPLNEGIAHRSETLLQHIFPEPAFPLFVAYRRLHTAVRIKVDLVLHHFGRPVSDGVQIYQQYMRFSRDAARGQVRFQELWPGYMTIYYYGQKYLSDLQDRLGWDDETFTELIFSVGYSGLNVLEEIIRAAPEERDAAVRM